VEIHCNLTPICGSCPKSGTVYFVQRTYFVLRSPTTDLARRPSSALFHVRTCCRY